MLQRNYISTEFEEMMVEGDPVRIRIEQRTDPFFPLHTTTISDKRADKPGRIFEKRKRGDKADRVEKEKCYFEPSNIHQTPKPREYHPELEVDGYVPVSVSNKHGFSLLGRVNCYTSHDKKYPEMLQMKDWMNYLLISAKNANRIVSEGYGDMFNIINFGKLAGGSQPHPHSQDGVLVNRYSSTQFRELDMFFHLEQNDDHPFETRANFLRKQGLECFEDDSVFISAPYAPRFPDELELTLKTKVCNFRQLPKLDAKKVANGLYHAVHFLSTEREVTDFNVIAHQDSLLENSEYRMHFHILPRNKNVLGGVEIGFNGYIVDTWPEATALAFRKYMERVPEEEM